MKNAELNYAQLIEAEMKKIDFHYSTRRREEETVFLVPMRCENSDSLDVRLFVSDRGDCKIRCYPAKRIPKAAEIQVLKALNKLNSRFRYITLSLDTDRDICAAYDFAIISADAQNVGKHAMVMLHLFTEICNDCYPDIQRAIWSAPEPAPVSEETEDTVFRLEDLFDTDEDTEEAS